MPGQTIDLGTTGSAAAQSFELDIPKRCEDCGSEIEIRSTTYPPTFYCQKCRQTTKVRREGWVIIPDERTRELIE